MADLINIFNNNPEKYDLLVSKEDYKKNLLNTILNISHINVKSDILDMGAGTGRISFMLSQYVNKIFAFDKVDNMIKTGEMKAKKEKVSNIEFGVADNTKIPLKDNSVDLSIEGWAFLAMRLFSEESPLALMKKAINEMERVTKKNGYIIIIETQGTCVDAPILQDLPQFKMLTDELGFKKEMLETDYKFDSVEEALDLIDFFFDKEGKKWVEKNNTEIVMEFTGLWWKQKK